TCAVFASAASLGAATSAAKRNATPQTISFISYPPDRAPRSRRGRGRPRGPAPCRRFPALRRRDARAAASAASSPASSRPARRRPPAPHPARRAAPLSPSAGWWSRNRKSKGTPRRRRERRERIFEKNLPRLRGALEDLRSSLAELEIDGVRRHAGHLHRELPELLGLDLLRELIGRADQRHVELLRAAREAALLHTLHAADVRRQRVLEIAGL